MPLVALLAMLMTVPVRGHSPDGGQTPVRESVNIFGETTELAAGQESNPAVIRSRRIGGALTGVRRVAAGNTWRLELFDDLTVVAVIEQVSAQGNGLAISGRIEIPGEIGPAGTLSAVVHDGLLSVVIETGRRTTACARGRRLTLRAK